MNKKNAESLRNLGMKPHLKGYHMAIKALDIMETKPLPVNMGNLYIEVAEIENCKPGQIERGIRTAIEISWCSENTLIHKIFSNRPTVSEFMHEVVEMVRLEAVA